MFATFAGLGGERGWLYADWCWQVRGALDRLVGGVGLRRGRRDPDDVRPGDSIDCWRVEAVEPGRLLRLTAEMKLPGQGRLEFRATPASGGGSLLVLTASFAPRGLPGLAYWYAMYPAHHFLFSGLARAIVRRAESAARASVAQVPAPEA